MSPGEKPGNMPSWRSIYIKAALTPVSTVTPRRRPYATGGNFPARIISNLAPASWRPWNEKPGKCGVIPAPILLSFTSDPYQSAEKTLGVTRKALEILTVHGLTVTVLTKGGAWGVIRDTDLLKTNPSNAWSVTLTLDDPVVSVKWEPGAALPADRIESLRRAYSVGIKTWVSFEPVLDPEAVYRLLDQTSAFVDFYKVGKLNYHPLAREIDWRRFMGQMEERLSRL
jgi:DNA repair photolyase